MLVHIGRLLPIRADASIRKYVRVGVSAEYTRATAPFEWVMRDERLAAGVMSMFFLAGQETGSARPCMK